jgi:hypothetical protein
MTETTAQVWGLWTLDINGDESEVEALTAAYTTEAAAKAAAVELAVHYVDELELGLVHADSEGSQLAFRYKGEGAHQAEPVCAWIVVSPIEVRS